MTPYRQPIRGGQSGRDVLAVKRALRKMGAPGCEKLAVSGAAGEFAGSAFVACLKALQAAHTLAADGVYGPATHRLVAPHFDLYGIFLYRTARIRKPPSQYLNPFAKATVEAGRIDMGVDYHGRGPIGAIGDATVIGSGGTGWPGGHFLLYQLRNGEHKGRYIYVAEAVLPVVVPGQNVGAGETVCFFAADAAPGVYPGIETGWGTPIVNEPLAVAMGDTGGPGHSDSPAGLCFARLLHRLGAPVSADPGAGPEYPLL